MAGGEGGKKILEIPIDDSAWQDFLKSFAAYQAQLGQQGQAWSATNDGIRKTKNSFEDAERSFEGFSDAAESPKLTKAFAGFGKTSRETEKAWLNVSKSIDRSSRDLAGLLRNGSKFSSLMGFFGLGAAGAIAGSLFGAVRSADTSLAGQNIANRKLGLKPGEEQAFDSVYEKAGGDSALLSKVSAAQANPAEWGPLRAAGLSQADIMGMDAADLSAKLLENVGGAVKSHGLQQESLWAHAMGIDRFVDTNGQRLAGSYADKFGEMHQQYQQAIPGYAQTQKDLDAATAAHMEIEKSLTQVEVEFQKALIKLNPEITELTGEVTAAIKAFVDGGDLDKAIKTTETAFEDIGKAGHWLADTLNNLFGLHDADPSKARTLDVQEGGLGARLMEFGRHPIDVLTGKDKSAPGYQWNYGAQIDKMLGTPPTVDNLLDAIRQNESGGRADAVNPVSGAAGLYGIMPANYKTMGIDPHDPVASRKAARTILSDFLKTWNGDTAKALASYDGDSHVGADSKNYGDMWLKGAKQETIDYLKKVENQGIDIGLSTEQQSYLDAHTKVKTGTHFDDHRAVRTQTAADKKLNAASADINAANPDNRAVDALAERIKKGMGAIGNGIRDTFADGGGAQFRSPDQPARTAVKQAPIVFSVTTTAPPGMSTTVSAGSIAQ